MVDTIVSGGGPLDSYESTSLGYQPPTRIGTDVATYVRRQFGDESAVQIVDTDIIRWINSAQESIVNRNKVLKARSSTYSIVGVTDYSLPGFNIQQVEGLWYNGSVLPGKTFAQAQLDMAGRVGDGEPIFWYEWGGTFRLWPSPPSVQKIELYYTMRPTPIAILADTLSVPDKYFQAVVAYCLQQAYEMDEDSQTALSKGQQFDSTVNTFGEEDRTAQNMTYQTITIVEDF